MADDHFLTTDEALGYLNINLRTIYRLIKAGEIPAVRVGRQWRFRKRDIDTWLAKHHSRAGARRRVLVVDDEASVREVVARMLESDYDVEMAPDGSTAIERLEAAAYDLLITDLKMPGMDGLSVIREARRTNEAMPIVIITGNSTEASAIEAINLGVNGYLTKPFRLPRIRAVCAKALGDPVPAES